MIANGRGIGVTEALHGSAEGPVVVLFGLLTQLGDVWFLFLLGGALYVVGAALPRWGIDRRRGLFVVALALVSVALVGVFKAIFALPRPPGAGDAPVVSWIPPAMAGVFRAMTTADSPGFPSGHALGSTMVWGGLALVLTDEPYRDRVAIAATVVGVVGLSRLVLGLHYLVDVVVGALLGLAALGALYRLSDRGTRPGRVLLVAVGVGATGLLVTVTVDGAAALGGAVGAWFVWRRVAMVTPVRPSNRTAIVAGFVVLGAAGALFWIVYARTPALPVAFLGAAVAAAGTVGAPVVGERLAGSDPTS